MRPDVVADRTLAHDRFNGYLPMGWKLAKWQDKRQSDPKAVVLAARRSMAEHVRAMLKFHQMGVPTVDYGNNICQIALEAGVKNAFDFPGFDSHIFDYCSVEALGLFAGPRYRAIQRTSIARTKK